MSLDSALRSLGRRRVLQWLAVTPAALALAGRSLPAMAENLLFAPRSIAMRNLHTGEELELRYFEQGSYIPEALAKLNRVLRDHRSGEVATMDPGLFDQLHALSLCTRCEPRYEIISGYRSPASNAKLRAASSGVASKSLHMEGRAIDVRPAGTTCSRLRDFALDMKAGGVGYYAKSNFVHLDTGRVRSWAG